MYINKRADGRNNVCGIAAARIRKAMGVSQRELADRLQLYGHDIDKNAVQRLESGQRFVTDIELIALCSVLYVQAEDLLYPDEPSTNRVNSDFPER